MTQVLPTREEVDIAHRWRVEDLFIDDSAWEQAFKDVDALLEQAGEHRGRLTSSSAALLAGLQWSESVGIGLARVYTYAMLRHDEDTANAHYQALYDRATGLRVRAMQATAFFRPELLAAPEDLIRSYLQQSDALKIYEHYIDDILRQRPHVLSPEVEEVLAQSSELAQLPYRVFSMLNDADLRFPSIIDEDGREIEVTKGRYIDLLQRQDRRVRRDAHEAVIGTYQRLRNTLAASLDGAVKANVLQARVRRYPSALAAALDDEAIDPKVYGNLVTTMQDRLGLLHRYAELRRRILGLDQLAPYDLHVPLLRPVDMRFSYDDACRLVKAALAPLGDDYGRILDKALNEGWIDVYENRGKRAGAYSMGWAYGVHPFVLMNWQDNLNDVFTLAHELGHAVHSYLSQQQPYIYAGHTIFVAEVASTLNESLLVQHLLGQLEDTNERAYVLNHYLDDFRGTVFGQVLFAEFEQWIHEQVESGHALTADALTAAYLRIARKYWGPAVHIDDESGIAWARVPHFYYNFYVYKYATGFAAATALADAILTEGELAVTRYLQFLRRGTSAYPLELLKDAGVDMLTSTPLVAAMERFAEALAQLESAIQ